MKKLLLSLLALSAAGSVQALNVADVTDVASQVDQAPVPLRTPPPAYPKELNAEHVSGIAVVTIVVDEKGDVIASEVKNATHAGFKRPALTVVKNWKFKPAIAGGKPVKVKVNVPIHFAQD